MMTLTTVALVLDWGMVLVAAWTAGLICYKAFELLGPPWRRTLEQASGPEVQGGQLLLERAQRGLTSLSAIASTLPFVGLAATVVHVIDALEALNSTFGQMSVISGPIAHALISTLLGLASAIPAQAAWHYFDARVRILEERIDA